MRGLKEILVSFLLLSAATSVAENVYKTRVLTPDAVKTLQIRYWDTRSDEAVKGDPQRPFLVMEDGGIGENGDVYGRVLEISFDEMSHEVRHYTYSLVHLNADGTESRLNSSEYVDGFTTQDITQYEHSLNTSELYTHYSFTFPNSDMHIKASGNYALRIYEDGDTDKTVAIVCFAVATPKVVIKADVRANTDIELNGRFQQLDIDVDFGGSMRNTRNEDYFIVVRQNGRYDNQAFAPKPTFLESSKLRFTNCRDLIFEGGNEYRHFDTYSTYFAGTGVDRIVHDHNDYHAVLFADALRGNDIYIHQFDVDGQRVVNAERTLYDIDTEAEYMWVHWTLMSEQPWFDGIVYVGGDVFENTIRPRNRMQYDAERKCYWLTALVKQGGVDYQYWFVPKGQEKVTLQRTEGSHWQTENEYTIYVYYKPFGSRYDQLVGLQVLKSWQ